MLDIKMTSAMISEVSGAPSRRIQDRIFFETKFHEWKQVVAQNPQDFETLTGLKGAP
jgi:hypothetical protein